ncbi:MAG: GGDEF domain-containing protein [Candidatus Thiodiazotropha sp. (ex Notomyrtea botanica)]|nr:GGDEF domain-containing protein [Candidatus Thiodiazotropha sp. (ex Notomyrtea botanica)]
MDNATMSSIKTGQRVYHQRVRFLYQGGIRAISFNIINAVLLFSVYWFQLPPTNLVIWLIVLTLVSIARMVHTGVSLERDWDNSIDQSKLRAFRIGVFVTAVIWGGGFTILSPGLDDTYTLLFLFTLAGMSSGAFSSMASDRFTYLFYILPMLIPATISTALQGNILSLVMTIMLILFTFMLAVTHKMASQTLAEGFEYRFEHEDLVKELLNTNETLKSTNDELERTKEDLKKLSLSDELTRAPNRRHLMQVLEQEIQRARREQTPLSAIMIDVDHFKLYNDTYGHAKGDQCLRIIAEHLQNALQRSSDFLARYGGEEFVALLPNTTPEQAQTVAERMRMSIFFAGLEHSGYSVGKVTVSAGIACCTPNKDRENCSSLIESADRSLYKAKQDGRNRVAIHDHNSVVVPLIPGDP